MSLSTYKERYLEFTKDNPERVPLFYRAYWLDTVCGNDNWQVLLDATNETIKSAFVYYKKKKYGITAFVNPPFTPYSGVLFFYPENLIKKERKYSFEIETTKKIIKQIKIPLLYDQSFDPKFYNWMPFYWENYRQNTRYTYKIEAIQNIESQYKKIKSNTKTVIRKAEKSVHLDSCLDLSLFYRLYQKTYQRQKQKTPYNKAFFQNIYSLLGPKDQISQLNAIDKNNNTHATILLVEDDHQIYCISIGSDPSYRNSGAISFLIWEGVKISLQKNKTFDFEGSIMPNIETIFRSFGATQIPYHRIYKSRNKALDLFFTLIGKF